MVELDTKESGNLISNMDMESKCGLMDLSMRVTIIMVKNKVKENSPGPTAIIMSGYSKRTTYRARVHTHGLMADVILAHG